MQQCMKHIADEICFIGIPRGSNKEYTSFGTPLGSFFAFACFVAAAAKHTKNYFLASKNQSLYMLSLQLTLPWTTQEDPQRLPSLVFLYLPNPAQLTR